MLIKEAYREYFAGCPRDRRSIQPMSLRVYETPQGDYELVRSYGHFSCAKKVADASRFSHPFSTLTVIDVPGLMDCKSWIAAERLLNKHLSQN